MLPLAVPPKDADDLDPGVGLLERHLYLLHQLNQYFLETHLNLVDQLYLVGQ